MKLAAAVAPDSLKERHLDLIRRLENKEDIKSDAYATSDI